MCDEQWRGQSVGGGGSLHPPLSWTGFHLLMTLRLPDQSFPLGSFQGIFLLNYDLNDNWVCKILVWFKFFFLFIELLLKWKAYTLFTLSSFFLHYSFQTLKAYCPFSYFNMWPFNPDPVGSKNITIPYPGAIFGSFLKLWEPEAIFQQYYYSKLGPLVEM